MLKINHIVNIEKAFVTVRLTKSEVVQLHKSLYQSCEGIPEPNRNELKFFDKLRNDMEKILDIFSENNH
tara:strand:- start:10407 stop:10613 length:207 start_codon:yes stop_codon:yes gene_type:complete